MLKQQCAERQRPSIGTAKVSNFATWEVVHKFLDEVLGSKGRDECIHLSNLKRFFRIRRQMELSETALGHTKLSEMLQDPRLHDVCSVRLQNHGYAVFPRGTQP